MWANGNETYMYDLLLQDEIVKHKVQKYIQQQVKTSRGGIPERFGRDEFTERRVKPLYGVQDDVP